MNSILNITSGDIAGKIIGESGVPGEVFVWHDILYDGPRKPGWPDEETLQARAIFLEDVTGGGLDKDHILETLKKQYHELETASKYEKIILWFDACLFDQAMLSHILACLKIQNIKNVDLICVDKFPGIKPYNGLGQLSPEQMASCYKLRRAVTDEQFDFAELVDKSFAIQDKIEFVELSKYRNTPLPWIPTAVIRWIQEQPDEETGLGRLENLTLNALKAGCETPKEIFKFVSENDTSPQYWGDITLWSKINSLADRVPPLVKIQGPNSRLPQWEGISGINLFRIGFI